MAALRRVNYSVGQVLSVDDFKAEQDYHREKLRRHNCRLHGSGVVTGLTVSLGGGASRPTIKVTPGVAIDSLGNELEVEAESSVAIRLRVRTFTVVLRYVECPVQPVPVPGDGDDSDALVYSRIEEGCEVALIPDVASCPGAETAVSLARFVRTGGTWRRDRAFKRKRAR